MGENSHFNTIFSNFWGTIHFSKPTKKFKAPQGPKGCSKCNSFQTRGAFATLPNWPAECVSIDSNKFRPNSPQFDIHCPNWPLSLFLPGPFPRGFPTSLFWATEFPPSPEDNIFPIRAFGAIFTLWGYFPTRPKFLQLEWGPKELTRAISPHEGSWGRASAA